MNESIIPVSEKDVEEGKVCAILAYLFFVVGLLWYFLDENMKKNKFAAFHVKQAITLMLASTALGFGIGILAVILTITIIGILFIIPLMLLVFVPSIWTIIGVVYSLQGKMKPLPLIGEYGEKWFKF